MNALPDRRRGEPLLVLALIVTCWIGLRVATWQTAGAEIPRLAEPTRAGRPAERAVEALPRVVESPVVGPGRLAPPVRVTVAPPVAAGPVPLAPASETPLPVAPGLAGGHAMMWLAAVARMPSPEALLAAARAAPAQAMVPPAILSPRLPVSLSAQSLPAARSAERRWSADAWALVRGGGGTGAAGPGVATYGASQVGAVLRYRLAPGDAHRATAYLRASAALNGSGERETALGLAVRPVASLPVVVAAEGRIGRFADRTLARPAVMAVTELPPVMLPAGTRAEFYAQAGYVGGAGATPFADGQVRLDRRIVAAGDVELRAGAGAWGGAQRGAARLDAGPTATLGIAKGPAAARVGLDWRFRLAGSAEPASGPALTVSAGF